MHIQGNLSERDIMQLILDQHKHSATSLTKMVLESSNPAIRHECQNALNNTLNHQYQIFETMHQRGWYQPQQASPQEVAMAQRDLTTQLAQTGSMLAQGMGHTTGMTAQGFSQMAGMSGQGSQVGGITSHISGQTGGIGGLTNY
ncbi:MAG: spore coat protein [Carboxydocellales bacterium]